MRVKCLGGLANRLRVILSRMDVCREFIWEPTHEIANASLYDVLEPFGDVRVLESGDADLTTTDPDWSRGRQWIERYAMLRPVSGLLARVRTLREQMGVFDAMHVRRTDCIENAMREGNFTSDDEFHAFAMSSDVPMFLATDNGRTQRQVLDWIGHRLVTSEGIAAMGDDHRGGDGVRHTTLGAAVVDAWVCTGARRFHGSGGSSFSTMIRYMRGEER